VISELVEVGSEVQGQAVLNGADSMLRTDGCLEFARKFGLKICTIEDLKEFVERTEGKLEMGKVNGHVH